MTECTCTVRDEWDGFTSIEQCHLCAAAPKMLKLLRELADLVIFSEEGYPRRNITDLIEEAEK